MLPLSSPSFLYRKELNRRIVTELEEAEVDKANVIGRITILDAVHMVKDAWDEVLPGHIAKCFRHAGFFRAREIIEDDEADEDIDWAKLVKKPDNLTCEDFDAMVAVDDDIQVFGEICDEDLISNDAVALSQPEEDDEVIEPPLSSKELLKSLSVVRHFAFENGLESSSSIKELNNAITDSVMKRKKQTTIRDFFKS